MKEVQLSESLVLTNRGVLITDPHVCKTAKDAAIVLNLRSKCVENGTITEAGKLVRDMLEKQGHQDLWEKLVKDTTTVEDVNPGDIIEQRRTPPNIEYPITPVDNLPDERKGKPEIKCVMVPIIFVGLDGITRFVIDLAHNWDHNPIDGNMVNCHITEITTIRVDGVTQETWRNFVKESECLFLECGRAKYNPQSLKY